MLLLTATPIRQDAWSLHSLLCYIGVYYDWKKWRETFFELKTMPYMRFPAWFPRADWRDKLKPFRDKHCDIVSLHDIIKDLPQPEERIIKIKNKFVKRDRWTDEHKDEQKGKVDEILKLGYKKMIIVCFYTEQIDELKDKLKDEKPVYVLDGRTKNADEVKTQAQEADECYFIVQASMGFGWNGYMFGAIVFVSMMHSIVEYIQMTGRQRHLEHIITPQHIFLIGGKWDSRILQSIKLNKNFNAHEYEL
jgi:superfamily II DNA or RNA helicase